MSNSLSDLLRRSKATGRIIPLFLAALVLLPFPVCSEELVENPEATRLVKEYSGLEIQHGRNIQNEYEARQALEQAQRALESARRLNDKQAGAIADEAISIAQDALRNAQAQRAGRERRMAEISSLLGWKSKAGKIALGGIIKGDVYRKTKLGWARFDSRIPLFEGDELRTGVKGFLDIELDSGGRIALDENTTLVFAESGKDRSIFDLISGKLHGLVECRKTTGHPCKQQTYRTAIAILGVRGTEFTMHSLPG